MRSAEQTSYACISFFTGEMLSGRGKRPQPPNSAAPGFHEEKVVVDSRGGDERPAHRGRVPIMRAADETAVRPKQLPRRRVLCKSRQLLVSIVIAGICGADKRNCTTSGSDLQSVMSLWVRSLTSTNEVKNKKCKNVRDSADASGALPSVEPPSTISKIVRNPRRRRSHTLSGMRETALGMSCTPKSAPKIGGS